MNVNGPRFSFMQVGLLIIWWTAAIFALYFYGPNLLSSLGFAPRLCSADGVLGFFAYIFQPHFGFGLLVFGALLYGVWRIIKSCTSRWAWLSDVRWPIGLIVLLVALLIPLLGCKS